MLALMLFHARTLIATAWVGALWTTGFIVAPTLFATLSDRALAGTIAGGLFRVVAWVSLCCAALLFALLLQARRSEQEKPTKCLFYIIIAMACCTVVGYFALQPYMAELRLVLHSVADNAQLIEARKQFGILHAISAAIFFAQSLLGVLLMIKLR
tara:strand:+ start:393372 stop:393836 length:465 start_codon:yes stop_codon:yes gene_type:complete